jgi:deoxycytidine triphosphate deaminase
MSLLTYTDLISLVAGGILTGVKPEHINAASIDLTLGAVLHRETPANFANNYWLDPIDLAAKQSIHTHEFVMDESGYVLEPGEFVLASSEQVFNLPAGQEPEVSPDDVRQTKLYFCPAIAAEYKLKSTLARNALGHLLAGWCDPGWNGSVLTLELKNESRYHRLLLRPGMKIGQVVLWSGTPVPSEASYAVRGQYNNDPATTAAKGLK